MRNAAPLNTIYMLIQKVLDLKEFSRTFHTTPISHISFSFYITILGKIKLGSPL